MEPKFTPSGKRITVVGYRIVDGQYKSPKGYLWIGEGENYRKTFSEIIMRYREIVDRITKL